MQVELKELEREIEYHKAQTTSDPSDLFLPTLEGFLAETGQSFQQLGKLMAEMKVRFRNTLEYFGEDLGDGQPFTSTDEFFGIISAFLQSFSVSTKYPGSRQRISQL